MLVRTRGEDLLPTANHCAQFRAMVAASAETTAIAVYARDLGLEMECELYCDLAAALGIAQWAAIGKVRHLRAQGMWV